MSGNSSQNARKHGLTSKLNIRPEDQLDYDEIHNELLDTFNPETKDELLLLADMAHCRLLATRAHQIINLNIDEEARIAPKILGDRASESFRPTYDKFRDYPDLTHSAMMESHIGIHRLVYIVDEAHKRLVKPRPYISFKHICDVIRTLGSRVEIDLVTPEAFELMALYFAFVGPTEIAIEEWLKTCTIRDFKTSEKRLHQMVSEYPDRKAAGVELTRRISEHLQKLRDKQAKVNESWNLHVERSIAVNHGMGLGIPDRVNNSKLMYRYATTHANRYDRLADKLRSQIRNRKRLEELARKEELAKEAGRSGGPLHKSSPHLLQPDPASAEDQSRYTNEGIYPGKDKRIDVIFEVKDGPNGVEYVHGLRVGDYRFTDERKILKNKDLSIDQAGNLSTLFELVTKWKDFYRLEPPKMPGKTGEAISDIGFERLCDENYLSDDLLMRAIELRATYESQIGRRLTVVESEDVLYQLKMIVLIENLLNGRGLRQASA